MKLKYFLAEALEGLNLNYSSDKLDLDKKSFKVKMIYFKVRFI